MQMHLKIAVILLVVFAIDEINAAKINKKICVKRNGKFPMPGSLCKGFYLCTFWVPLERFCRPHQHFSTISYECEDMDRYPCFEKPLKKECLRANGRFLKPGTDCKHFYDCCNGEPTEKTCPRNQIFDPLQEKCEWKSLYSCVEDTSIASTLDDVSDTQTEKEYLISTSPSESTTLVEETPSETSPIPTETESTSVPVTESITEAEETPSETVPNPTETESTPVPEEVTESTTKDEETTSDETVQPLSTLIRETFETSTITIRDTVSTEEETQPTIETTLDEETELTTNSIVDRITDAEFLSTVGIDELTNEPNIYCPEPYGYHPHPYDKHKFVGCVDYIPNILICPSDMIYVHEKKICE